MTKKLLMIDDEEPILEAFQTILEDLGKEVTICSDVAEGEKRALEESYDLILVDLRMPGKDGAEVTKTIYQQKPDAKILIITGYPTDPMARKAMDNGAVGIVKKPFEIGKILDFLQDD